MAKTAAPCPGARAGSSRARLHVAWALRDRHADRGDAGRGRRRVSALVHIYSIGYMADDPHRARFFAYLSLFTFAMLMLVTADNFVQMFFGWKAWVSPPIC